MYQGEFVEKVLAGALSEPDIKNYIKGQPKKDLPGLLTYIHDRQGAIVAEGMFKDKNDYFNLQWRDDFNKLYELSKMVEEAIGRNKKRATLPDVLDTAEFKCQYEMAKVGGLISQEGAWIGGPIKLMVFALMINRTPGAMKPHRYHPYWKPFADYFGICTRDDLASYFSQNTQFTGTEDDNEKYIEYLYPTDKK